MSNSDGNASVAPITTTTPSLNVANVDVDLSTVGDGEVQQVENNTSAQVAETQGEQQQQQQPQNAGVDNAFSNFFNNYQSNNTPQNQPQQNLQTNSQAQSFQNTFNQSANNQVNTSQNTFVPPVQPSVAPQTQQQEQQITINDFIKAPESEYIAYTDEQLIDLYDESPDKFIKANEERAFHKIATTLNPILKTLQDDIVNKVENLSKENIKTYLQQQQEQENVNQIIGEVQSKLVSNGINLAPWEFDGLVREVNNTVVPVYENYLAQIKAFKDANLQIPTDKLPLNKNGQPLSGPEFCVNYALLISAGNRNQQQQQNIQNNNVVQTRPNIVSGSSPNVSSVDPSQILDGVFTKFNIN